MFGNQQLSVEQLVAMSMGDEDWDELSTYESEGCSHTRTSEREVSREEAEPNIDRYTSDQLHAARRA